MRRERGSVITRHSWVTVFAVALLVRLVFVIPLGAELMKPLRDQRLYLRLGESIAAGRGLMLGRRTPGKVAPENQWKQKVHDFWVGPDDPGMGLAPEGRPTAIIEPLYPLLLGLGSRLWAGNLLVTRILQACLGALSALLLCALGRKLGGRHTGLIAGLGFAFYPHLVYYSGIIATETLFIFLQLLALWRWALWVEKPDRTGALFLGVASGGAFLTRASMLPLGVVLLCLAVWRQRSTLRTVPAVVLGFALITAPWVIRNGHSMGEYRLLPTKGGLNLWMQNHPDLQQLQLERIGTPIPRDIMETIRCRELEQFPAFPDSVREVQRDRILTTRALRYISCNSKYFLYMCWLRCRWYFRFAGSSVRGGLVDFLGSVSFGLLLVFGTIGIWRGRRESMILMAGLVYLMNLVSHTLFHGGIRYRIPADSVFLLPAALALGTMLERVATRCRWKTR